uniref:SKI/SNO/DAC domain-containing protein n=1 Tax=Dicentrarchus labrax TaxID=13489 RepID=A0A8P4FX87_DICLA
MSLPGSPPLLSPGSGAPTSAALYRSAPDALHTSVASTGTSSPAHTNSHSHPHSLSPRLTSSMLSAFLPGLGNGGSAPLVSGGGGALGPLGGLGSLSTAGLTPGSPGLAQTSSSPGLCSECKLVEVHGVKVASFSVDGQELICLPQVFDLFLKHLVGGLHTVYTKLKRLDISPVVCTVEQVRVLRGLGAIQPGVNRCKLISRKDFETLYQDCTSARPSASRKGNDCHREREAMCHRVFTGNTGEVIIRGFLLFTAESEIKRNRNREREREREVSSSVQKESKTWPYSEVWGSNRLHVTDLCKQGTTVTPF